jgi:hypothetical protein
MDFSEKLDALQGRVASAKMAMQSAASESREQLKHRIDKAQDEADHVVQHAEQQAKQQAKQAATGARSGWEQLKADVAAKTGDAKAKIDERGQQLDVKVAAREADRAEAEAAEALDFADWAIVNAEVAIFDAIDARLHADERARTARV